MARLTNTHSNLLMTAPTILVPIFRELISPNKPAYPPAHKEMPALTKFHSVDSRQIFPDRQRCGFHALDHKGVWRAIVIDLSNTQ